MSWTDVAVLGLLIVLVGWVIFSSYRRKKKGIGGCGSCTGCPHAGSCGQRTRLPDEDKAGSDPI